MLGTLLGTLFMAFHSAQGPQLGLPQMIQSRPQFGYLGALLVWFFAYVQYAGFNVFNSILGGESVQSTVHHGSTKFWVVIVTIVAFVIALIGYDLIHRAEQFLTYAMLLIFGIFTITLFFIHYPAGTFDIGSFKATPFLGQFGVVAGYQISWAIYVSDYSRYLPPGPSTVRKTFLWTYWGSAIGGGWMMVVGAVLAAWAGKNFDGSGIAEIHEVGDKVFSGFGGIVLILARAGAGVGDGAQHVRRIPDVDQRHRLVQPREADGDHPGDHGRADRRALGHRCAGGHDELPEQLQQLPAADPVPCSSPGRRSTSSTTTSCGAGITRSPRSSNLTACTGDGAGAASSPTSSGSRA